ncbi:P-loop containing nucleoside triphosphate hydrolase protein [Multifurca ochricompacta]|uniref:P-loop containing nucleoside triphosphate hydrolase protein n=1 Tax=Multifurca ochricompacta TaxID=376703 RepID=A0AAD4M1Q3_9AGAM|nr:P-loop containing nucleoside triphosphate hydrolase protein [Multifurca ochricompacta]
MTLTDLSPSTPHTSEQIQKTRVILVGIGGATCSGKTTLAKHLRNILPDSFIIHQDDFAPPEATLPIHPTLGQDWDTAPTAIAWPRLRTFLHTVKRIARIPDDHSSHDHLNEQKPVPLTDSVAERWTTEITRVQKEVEAASGTRVVWGLVDGFLLYWDQEVVDTFDAKVFLRVPCDVLKERRKKRSGYATAEQMNTEGAFWKDPPDYFEQLVYPAYVDAHRSIFINGDVEQGSPLLPNLVLIESLELSMNDIVERCCEELIAVLRKPVATVTGEVQC